MGSLHLAPIAYCDCDVRVSKGVEEDRHKLTDHQRVYTEIFGEKYTGLLSRSSASARLRYLSA